MNERAVKICFKCKVEKTLDEYYKHSQMSDGHLNKCKECTKKDTKARIEKNYEEVKAYDKQRANLPHRVALRQAYAKTDRGRERARVGGKAWVKRNPIKRFALTELYKALMRGDVKKLPCCVCEKPKSEAHHEDYTKPLDVIWYCKKHHMDRHKEMRDAGFVWDELGRPVLKEN